ncbi:hypothetical protein GCM10009786_02330 [Leucobacter alluvii]|uniref:Uncharacterized protein n=1 Tax=Leucobacter alluvii TaxID=340321 RepID=A0ABN3B3B8_9MICO
MSKDPFEELFGPADAEPPAETRPVPPAEPQPVPARDRLSYEQAERVRTAQLSTEPRSEGTRAAPKALPWIVVGAVAVIAIIVCIVLVNLARGGSDDGNASNQEPTTTAAPSATPSPSSGADDADADDADAEDTDPDEVPAVEVGPTTPLDIPAWGVTSQLSLKFGMTSYSIPDNVNLQLSSPLINSLPEECAAMRTQWGITQGADGTYSVLKPAERCEAAPELYDELWGLTDAFAKSITPAG